MDSKKTIKSYIQPAPWVTVVACALLAFALIAFVIGVTASGNDDAAEATQFSPIASEPGAYAYIDVIGVSNWLYNYDGSVYYAVEDAEHYYAVRLSDSEYGRMTKQQEYWMRDSQDAEIPAPYRLYGLTQNTTQNIRESLASSVGLTESDFDAYFGTMFLNATSSPSGETSAIWLLAAFFALLFGLICLLINGKPNASMKRCFKRIEELGELDTAAEELLDPSNMILENDRIRLSENYIFSKKLGVAVRYADVIWCFRRIQKYNFITVGQFLVANTAAAKELTIASLAGKSMDSGTAETIMQRLNEKNPDALLGFTSENAKAYRERKKAAKAAK